MTGTMTTDITLSMNVLEDPSWPEFEIPRESSLGYPNRAPAVLSLATRRSDTLERAAEVDSFTRRSTESAFKSDRGTRYAGLLEVSENTLGKQFWINILLTLLGYIPSIVHAVWVI